MPTCDYCDQQIEPGVAKCPYCNAPRDPSGDPVPSARSGGQAGAPVAAQAAVAGGAAAQGAGPAQGQQNAGAGISNIVQSLQSGDVGGVAKGLQDMASSGQLDVNKLAGDLGVSSKGLDLGDIAKSLTSGGSQSSNVVSALSQQGGGLGDLLKSAAGALKSPTGLAVGGAALAAGAVGAGYLIHRSRGGGSIKDTLGSMIPGGGGEGGGIGDTLGSLLGGSGEPTPEETAQYTQIAEQLPPASYEELKEGMMVLAQWDQNEWRPAKVGWVDGGQARVTFDSGLERWCDPQAIRLPPQPGHPVQHPTMVDEGPAPGPNAAGLPAVGSRIQAQAGPEAWQGAEVIDIDTIGERVQVRYDNGFEVWLESDQIKPVGS